MKQCGKAEIRTKLAALIRVDANELSGAFGDAADWNCQMLLKLFSRRCRLNFTWGRRFYRSGLSLFQATAAHGVKQSVHHNRNSAQCDESTKQADQLV